MKRFVITAVISLVFSLSHLCGKSQTENGIISHGDSAGNNFVTMAAGNQFSASHWKEFWWGKHWRKEWMTPANFGLLDMDTIAGGLIAIKRGGGHETKTLRLKGTNGKEYVLRTIDKSLDVLVPEIFKGSFVNDLVNDQISTAHPFGPLVIARLSAGINILHTNPTIVFVPYNNRLGQFSDDFANKLCLFEERPSGDGWEFTTLTGQASKIINSEKLFTKISEDNKRSVDQREFLKVRLLDMLVNDWDRHEDQWVWTEQQQKGKIIYRPFARDRDQAFSKTDGVSLYFLSRPWALRSIQNMDGKVKDVIGTNLSATVIDKKFTNELAEEDWIDIIATLQAAFTDSLIASSLKVMPDNIYSTSGSFLYSRLRQRRDDMMRFGLKYYKTLNKTVTLTGSDQTEIFIINRKSNLYTEIIVQAQDENQKPADTIYHRIFYQNATKEINLYGLGGNDRFIFTGIAANKIKIRVLGGEGEDQYQAREITAGTGKRSLIYDAQNDKPQSSTAYRYKTISDTSFTNYNRKLFKYDWWVPLFVPGYNPDDGVVIGAKVIYKKQQWNKKPYGWQQSVGGDFAASTGAWNIYYNGLFKKVFGKWDADITLNYNAPAYVLNFYGYGNETKTEFGDKDFYRVRARGIYFKPGVSRSWKNNFVSAGLVFNTVKVETPGNKFINQSTSLIDSSIFTTKYFGGTSISWMFNNTGNLRYPMKGVVFHAASKALFNLLENKRNFLNLQSDFIFYISPFTQLTIAHRSGVYANIGAYEFYQACTIGGDENLRGYWRNRFAGHTAFYQNTDLRLKLANLKGYVLRGALGVYGFLDDGRVWAKEEQSYKIHIGYGAGIYFLPYNKLALNMSYALSADAKVFTIRTGFLF